MRVWEFCIIVAGLIIKRGCSTRFLLWLFSLWGWDRMTIAFTGKFVYIAHHFILLHFSRFDLSVITDGRWFDHSVSLCHNSKFYYQGTKTFPGHLLISTPIRDSYSVYREIYIYIYIYIIYIYVYIYITKYGKLITNCLLLWVSCSRNHQVKNFSCVIVLQINYHWIN